MSDIFEKLLILRLPRIGPVRYAQLISAYGTPAAVVESMNLDMAHYDMVRREMDVAAQQNIQYIPDDDARYPTNLRAVKNHPPIICVRGNVDTLNKPMVSIVGTRHATGAGMGFVKGLAASFAKHGVVVVSGMAIGTDSAAHAGALSVDGNAQTIAVLAGGVDYIWPVENESLYWRIVERGAIISEMPVGFIPSPTNFAQRNRWIAGMSEKLILGEADMNSGSMTTARFAIEIGRPLWAIPSHPADLRAAGPNSLISDGLAKLCRGESDFFDLGSENKKSPAVEKNFDMENILFDSIGIVPVSESVLADIVKKTVSEIKRDLVILELRGMIRKTDGGYVRV